MPDGYPINVLNQVKAVPEVCRIYCAAANQVDVLVAVTDRGRGVAGVIDGKSPPGISHSATSATSSDAPDQVASAVSRSR